MGVNSYDAQPQRNRVRKLRKDKFDYRLFIVVLFVLIFGLVMIYSTSYYSASLEDKEPAYWMKKQAFFAAIGIAVMFAVSKFDYHQYRKLALSALIVVDILLILVLVIGEDVNGAKRWIQIGPLPAFQPSEIAKVAVIVSFAALLNQYSRELTKLKVLVGVCIVMLPTIGLIGVENMSTALIIIAIIGIMLFVTYPKILPIIIVGLFGVAAAFIMLNAESYRKGRIEAWRNPETAENGYQTLQSLYAIGSGGLTGKGLGQSLQKLGFIPEAHNDMIFSIICEELGFIGAMGVIVLFIILILRMVKIALNARDLYGSLIVVGVIAHIGVQVLINIAVVTNTIPNTGVTLPFISYGGTSMIILFAEIGIVLNVARSIYREK